MKILYLELAILGAVIPYFFFAPFLLDGGTLSQFTHQLFATNPAGGFTADLLITSAVFWIWSYREAKKLSINHWWLFVVVNLFIGLSCALPLFLWVRHGKVPHSQDDRSAAELTTTSAGLASP